MSRQFYVYIHMKPDGTPFYVGKGTGRRANFFHGRSEYHRRIVDKYGRENIGVLTFNCESEDAAHAMEIEYIRQFRLAGVKLCNLSEGGEGQSGFRHTAETREKIGNAGRNRQWTDARKLEFALTQIGNKHSLGKKSSKEKRAKLSAVSKGRAKSHEHRAALSRAKLGKPTQPTSLETKQKISQALKGVPKSLSHRNALSIAARRNK